MKSTVWYTILWNNTDKDNVGVYFVYDFSTNTYQVSNNLVGDASRFLPEGLYRSFQAKFNMFSEPVWYLDGVVKMVGMKVHSNGDNAVFMGLMDNEYYLILRVPFVSTWLVSSLDSGFICHTLHQGKCLDIGVRCSASAFVVMTLDNSFKQEILSHLKFKLRMYKNDEKGILVSAL